MKPKTIWIYVGAVSVALVLGIVVIDLTRDSGSATTTQGAPTVRTAGEIPACVSPAYDYVCRDIEPRNLYFMVHPKKTVQGRTDDEALYGRFVSYVRPELANRSTGGAGNAMGHYVTFSVFFHWNRSWAKQFAAAGICEKAMGTKDNKCRNRIYYFFHRQTPETLANTILSDIVKTKPVARLCKLRRATKSPPKNTVSNFNIQRA